MLPVAASDALWPVAVRGIVSRALAAQNLACGRIIAFLIQSLRRFCVVGKCAGYAYIGFDSNVIRKGKAHEEA